MVANMPTQATLPCNACPHAGACCVEGADLTPEEAAVLKAKHGDHVVTCEGGDYRTAYNNLGCVFKVGGLCSIHGEDYYPAVCRAYPWTDGILGGPYQGDRQECPEFVTKE